ncbi:MAG: type II CAAX endopeptidase family protein [Bryobacteraceae bacterium]
MSAPAGPKIDKLAVLLRVVVYVFLAIAGMTIFPALMLPIAGYLVTAALSVFVSAAVANSIALRIWEQSRLSAIGLAWTAASRRNLLIGAACGLAGGLLVTLAPIAARAADLVRAPNALFQWPSLIFVSIVLLLGAVGEEMLFRGYAFQLLLGVLGPFATILPFGVLFGIAHLANQNVTTLGIVNTMLWGILLGYAVLRSGDLWLPIGLHFGWNWTLPLFGENLSGLTMGITGVTVRWKVGDLWSGGAYGPEGGLLTSVVIAALFFCLHRAPVQAQPLLLARLQPEARKQPETRKQPEN